MIKIYNNSKYFEIIVNALNYLFIKYNELELNKDKHIIYEIVDSINYLTNDIYIICDYINIKEFPKHYIIYNFEQLDVKRESNYNNILLNAMQIWDYSLINIEYLDKNLNVTAIFFPMGCTPSMILFEPIKWNTRENNMMFIGSMNNKRRDFLKPMHTYFKSNDLNMFLSNKCWDKEFLDICSITKISLNIHYYYGNTILEIHRIIPLILHNIWVCSERSTDKFYDELFHDLVDWIDTSSSVNQIKLILNKNIEEIEQELNNRKEKLLARCDYWIFFNNSKIYNQLIK